MIDHLDHVIVCVSDLMDAAGNYMAKYGLQSVEGGRHRGHGTANRIVPLGDWYLELIAVVDPVEAAASELGTWVTDRAGRPGADALCLRPDDFERRVEDLGLEPVTMDRTTPEGHILEWRLAGLGLAVAHGLPFFIHWDMPPGLHPGRIEVPGQAVWNATVVVYSDDGRLQSWVSQADHRVQSAAGPPQVSLKLH